MNKKILGYILLTISIICIILIVILMMQNNINVETNQPNNKITLEKFNNIQLGMTYDEVVDIIGEEGTVFSETNIMQDEQYKTTIYYWYANNGIANANITFQGGKVVSKAQLGLE